MFKTIILRLVRTAAAIGISFGAAYVANEPKLVWLAPLISALGKALRDKFGIKNIPI